MADKYNIEAAVWEAVRILTIGTAGLVVLIIVGAAIGNALRNRRRETQDLSDFDGRP